MAQNQEIVAVPFSDQFVDDVYFSVISEENEDEEIFPISDALYAEELQFQEALIASSIINSHLITINKSSASSSSPLIIQSLSLPAIMETKPESSLSFCEICVERKESDQMFKIEGCIHSFCSDCISKHVDTKIQDSIVTVTCPALDCKALLELDICRPVLPKRVIELWEDALCQELISAAQKFYCPFKDCSAMLVNENEEKAMMESECPYCHRLFCVQCNAPWHSGIECEEYQRLNEDERGREDLMVRELVKKNKWSRCPNCKFFVERTEGCPHITCRCSFQFCYGCEAVWSDSHAGCARQ